MLWLQRSELFFFPLFDLTGKKGYISSGIVESKLQAKEFDPVKKMTMRKLAELCNVSASTVSRALSGSGKVDKEVALRILNEARHRNYRFNEGHTRHWALLCKFDGESGSYELSMLDELTRCILARGDTFILPRYRPELLKRDWYDGVIAVSWLSDEEMTQLSSYTEKGIFVEIQRRIDLSRHTGPSAKIFALERGSILLPVNTDMQMQSTILFDLE